MSFQERDVILYRDKYYELEQNPLTGYLDTHNENYVFVMDRSTLVKGYAAQWVLGTDNKLYLTALQGNIMEKPFDYPYKTIKWSARISTKVQPVAVSNFFTGRIEAMATWFTGELKLYDGLVEGYPGSFMAKYESIVILKIEHGILMEAFTLD